MDAQSKLVCREEEEREAVLNEANEGSEKCTGYRRTNRYERVRLWSVSVRERLARRRHCRALSPGRVDEDMRGESVIRVCSVLNELQHSPIGG